MTCFGDLPTPTHQAKMRGEALVDIIRQAIADQHGMISFSHYMSLTLYHPLFGYYSADEFDIGQQGDFTTAPEISPLFARCFARQCQPILALPATRNILELGPGTGQFASDMLMELKQLGCLPERYYLYEISQHLRQKQQTSLASTHPDLMNRIIWLDELPQHFNGVIIGNEVLDALPFDCFQKEDRHLYERCVGWEKGVFVWKQRNASPVLQECITPLSLPACYQSEINLVLPAFVKSVCDSLERGMILFADYGYGQREYYHPERMQGTLTCFYRHHRHADPLILPGLQDITAHVDFTRVVDTASDAGCDLLGFTTQAGFLLANDLLAMAAQMERGLSPAEEFKLHQAVKLLTLPTEMGECIKVMALGKGIDRPIAGLSLQDRRRDL